MKKFDSKGFSIIEVLLILVIVGIIGGVGYYVYNAQQKESATVNDSSVLPKPEKDDNKADDKIVCADPKAADVENIKASITSGNTAALEGYMVAKLSVIFAASDGLGERTASEAVGDITSFIADAKAPWNFALPNPELTGYQNGFYKQYFPANAVVGKDANKKLISFAFNCDGKISGVFVASSSDIL